MTKLEEKLYEAIDGVIMSGKTAYSDLVDEILPLITEQDRIARQEERKRCVNAVQDAFCNAKQCKKFWICDHCCEKVMIAINGIKAIDEGLQS